MNDEFRDWLFERCAPGENLTREQLAQLATAIGHEPRFWRDYVQHDPETRYFRQLHRDANVDIWLECWENTQDTGYHDHDISSGAVYVIEGTLVEDYLWRDENGWIREESREHPAGSVFDFDGARIHGMRHPEGGEPATSIHVYSPSLWRMGWYEAGENGMRRTAITYADEMAAGEHAHA
jgi:hypothetical protein